MDVDLHYDPAVEPEAESYKQWCRLHPCETAPQLTTGHALWLDSGGLALLSEGYAKPFRLIPDMLDARMQGKSLLAKACGLFPQRPSIFDPFAGFGIDALLLARLGCQVTAVERHPVVWLLLRGFARDLDLPIATACADGMAQLADPSQTWDVIYLDPMFATRRKRALPNRGLQHLQDLSADFVVDLDSCLQLAQDRAEHRVVLKRRLKDPVCGKPAHQHRGHSVRFDVYL